MQNCVSTCATVNTGPNNYRCGVTCSSGLSENYDFEHELGNPRTLFIKPSPIPLPTLIRTVSYLKHWVIEFGGCKVVGCKAVGCKAAGCKVVGCNAAGCRQGSLHIFFLSFWSLTANRWRSCYGGTSMRMCGKTSDVSQCARLCRRAHEAK